MENAAKALLIAGGILIALIILTLVVYMGKNVKTIASTQEEIKAAEQLAAFNAEYEAYNKKLLYGTDVITVVNKAVENNKKGGYLINVVIIINKKNYTGYKETFDYFLDDKDEKFRTTEILSGGLNENKDEYTLLLENGEMNTSLVQFFNNKGQVTGPEITGTYKNLYTYTYPAIIEFKTDIFKCTEIQYTNGRVSLINFERLSAT